MKFPFKLNNADKNNRRTIIPSNPWEIKSGNKKKRYEY
jgi:hypothetical protein